MGAAVPATAFLDQEGRIVSRVEGQMREGDLRERLDWLLGDRTRPVLLQVRVEGGSFTGVSAITGAGRNGDSPPGNLVKRYERQKAAGALFRFC